VTPGVSTLSKFRTIKRADLRFRAVLAEDLPEVELISRVASSGHSQKTRVLE
jgi:hypothetical protein